MVDRVGPVRMSVVLAVRCAGGGESDQMARMTAVSWRDGAQELRRLVMAGNGVPDRIEDVGLA